MLRKYWDGDVMAGVPLFVLVLIPAPLSSLVVALKGCKKVVHS